MAPMTFNFEEWLHPTEAQPMRLDTFIEQKIEEQPDPETVRLEALTQQIQSLQNKLTDYESAVMRPIREAMQQIGAERNHAQDLYRKLMQELNDRQAEQNSALYTARQEKFNLDDELNKLSREQANLLKAMAAKKMLEEVETKINYLIADSPWGIHAKPYQLMDLKYVIAAYEAGKSGVMLAHDMGLGKTFIAQATDYCLQHLFQEKYGRLPQTLWVTSPSLIKQTIQEIKKWNPGRLVIPVAGSWNAEAREFATKMAIDQNAMLICNYEQFNTNRILKNTQWDIIFADEVSKLKGGANPKPTKVWTNTQELLWEVRVDSQGKRSYELDLNSQPIQRCKFFVPLSGTPVENKPGDMWAYLHLFSPMRFPVLKNFENEYAFGWPDKKVDFERLINVMSDQVIRRSKKDPEVNLNLPDKMPELREIELTGKQKELYESMKKNFFIFLDSKGDDMLQPKVVIEWIIRLWEISLYPGIIKEMIGPDGNKIPVDIECKESAVLDQAMEDLEQILAAKEKVVIWSAWFTEPLKELQKRIEKEFKVRTGLYIGEGSQDSKDASVESFQSDEPGSVQVMLCTMKSAGKGLNLQNSSYAIFLDRWWNPQVQIQAEDRQHRIGQKNPVVIIQHHATETVYDFVKDKFDKKSEMSNDIMGSEKLRKGSDWKHYLEGMI